jgi:fructose-bisphosphate aldolase, class II
MQKMSQWLEMEIGITGGEEDGVDNSGVDNAALYTQPEDIWDIYKAFSAVWILPCAVSDDPFF